MYDLTLSIKEGMQLFPGLESFSAELSIAEDTGVLTHRIELSTHQGTHVDAPAHYFDDGKTIDEIPLNQFVGPSVVIDLRSHQGEKIDADVLKKHPTDINEDDRVILITGDVDAKFGKPDFFDEAAVLTHDAAEWLVNQEISLLANDFLTEGLDDPNRPVHKALLGSHIPILEYICNTESIVNKTTVDLYCLPMALQGLDGAPARVIARNTEEE